MDTSYTPERGFFIGRIGTYLVALAAVAAIMYPSFLKADVLPSGMAITKHNATLTVRLGSNSLATRTKPLLAWITAYASVPEETSDHPFLTASGKLVRDGIVAANFLPFGTRIEIPALFGSKVFTVEDRMNQKYSSRVDIWMPTVDTAVDFGIRHAKIVILNAALAIKK